MIKLHVGCGPNYVPGWVNIDADKQYRADVYVDASKPLPYETDSVDAVLNQHFIEHLTLEEGMVFLKDCVRILKPGGLIRISTPDLLWLVQDYNKSTPGNLQAYWCTPNFATRCEMLNFSMKSWQHKFTFDEEDLTHRLMLAGFKNIVRRNNSTYAPVFEGVETGRPECLTLEAEK